MSTSRNAPRLTGRDILVAFLGSLTTIVAAMLTNLDKVASFFPWGDGSTQYQASSTHEDAARNFLKLARGGRSQYEDQARHARLVLTEVLVRDGRHTPAEIARAGETFTKALPTYEKVVEDSIPIVKKHLAHAELDAINKHYSSSIMQKLADKQALMNQEFLVLIAEHLRQATEKLDASLK